VFVATGLWKPFRIGLSGANLEGVHAAADVLKAVARGPRPHLGARVVVIGGGNVAMDAATAAKALGAERVDLCCLESFDEMPAFRSEIEHAQAQGVEFHTRTRPVRVLGRNGRVAGYEGVGIRWKTPGSLAPSNAEDLKGTEFRLLADAVIEAIGQGPLDGFEGLATGERGLVVVEPEAMAASVPGVFAGGDIVSGGATVVQAVAEGKRAAAAIVAYLNGRRAGPDHGAQGERKGGRR